MDAAYNYFKKTAILFAIALLSAAPSFGAASAKPDIGHSDRVELRRPSALPARLASTLR